MKKLTALAMTLLCLLTLTACGGRTMDDIIANEPKIVGIVEEVHDDYVLLYAETDAYPDGAEYKVSLEVENEDSMTALSVGDEIAVYYDGSIAETDPLEINTVYAITLRTPANRAGNNKS